MSGECTPLLSENPRVGLGKLLHLLQGVGGVDVTAVGYSAQAALASITVKSDDLVPVAVEVRKLEARWYKSLAEGTPDYSVYGSAYYLAELWACWIIYSRKYLRALTPPQSLPPDGIAAFLRPVYRVLDLGCGFGYTAVGFKELFPDAQVIGTNLPGTVQFAVAQKLAERFGFLLAADVHAYPGAVDLVFASEYFEHILAPLDHLREVVTSVSPRFLLVANAFGATAIGHFLSYKVGGDLVPAERMSTLFGEEMKRLGYGKVKTKLWNNRPTLWRKAEESPH